MTEKIKTITLWEPWASLMAHGIKTIETRSWATNHRGLLAIHAAKRFTEEQSRFCDREPIKSALRKIDPTGRHTFYLGCVLALVNLTDCKATNYFDPPQDQEPFGDFSPDRYAWLTKLLWTFKSPIPVRGHQGLWSWKVRKDFNEQAIKLVNKTCEKK